MGERGSQLVCSVGCWELLAGAAVSGDGCAQRGPCRSTAGGPTVAPLYFSLFQNRSVRVAQCLRLFLLLLVLRVLYSWLVLRGLLTRERVAVSKAVPRTGYHTGVS